MNLNNIIMKKIFIFIALVGFCFSADAQLYVDNTTGNVGVKDNSPEKPFTIAGNTTLTNFGTRYLDFDNLYGGTFSNTIDKNGIRWIAENQNFGTPDSLRFHMLYNYGLDKLLFDVNDNYLDGVAMSIDRATEYVGIGTDTALTTLHVAGDSYVSGNRYMFTSGTSNPNKMIISHSPSFPTWGLEYHDINDAFAFRSSSGTSLYISSYAGAIGVGTETLTYAVNISGDIGMTGTIYGVSDRRAKRNFLPLESALDKINQLNPVSYEFNTEAYPDLKLPENRHMGLIAQEVQTVFPELVSTPESEEEMMSLNYMELIPALVKSVQELNEKLDEKDAEIKALQEQIDKLK